MLENPTTVALLKRISAKVTDGTIILMALLGSLTYSVSDDRAVIVVLGSSLFAIALTHAFAATMKEEMTQQRILPWRERGVIFADQAWVMSATLVPILFYSLALLGVITQANAFRLTEILLAGVLFGFGFLSRQLSGGGVLRSSSYGAVIVVLGLLVIELGP
jgi:hypothetical protein